MYKIICLYYVIFSFISNIDCYAQTEKHNWFLGVTWSGSNLEGRIQADSSGINLFSETRKMNFDCTQANISDLNGNYIISSNGVWIANALGDTMLNGGGLNPNSFTSDWSKGLPLPNGNLIVPFPGDSNKFALFHQTGNYLANLQATELYYSEIDMSLDNGLGGVSVKNQVVFQDTLGWGIGACKHANGRDWWIVAIKNNSKTIYKVLLTPIGISSVTTQVFANIIAYEGNANQPVFSPDGSKFAFLTGYYPIGLPINTFLLQASYFNFDNCTGLFSNHQMIDIDFGNLRLGFATAFSSNSKYLYASSVVKIVQINCDTTILKADSIAFYDGFSSINNTNFWLMYLAADKKIYITSNGGVQHMHVIEFPDSGGLACSVQQHSIVLPCYHDRSVPNHPNYLLGAKYLSPCDSLGLGVSVKQLSYHTIKFTPNPANTNLSLDIDGKFTTGVLNFVNLYGISVKQLVISSELNNSTIDVSDLINGIYIVNFNSQQQSFSGKLVIFR